MPEKKVKIPFPDPTTPGGMAMVEGSEVAVRESTERWTEITLEDGTVMRVKPTIFSAIRITGRYDNEGNPMYAMKGGQAIAIVSVPDSLKKQTTGKIQ
jgi:hypothetical protein